MRSITSFDNFKNDLNEETEISTIWYTKDDVENAFLSIKDDLSDYYSINTNDTDISLDWNIDSYGNLKVECLIDNIIFDFDNSSFTRDLIRNLSHDTDSKGPTFSKDEIKRAVYEVDYDAVFIENIDLDSSNIVTNISVNQNNRSTELTVTGEIDEDSVNMSQSIIDTDKILEKILEELYTSVARRIDYT
jgi:hypothetical protein